MAPGATSFAVLAGASCPTYDDMLIALEHEFRPVDRRAVAEALDELARPLFGVNAGAASHRTAAVVRAAHAAMPQHGHDPDSWLISSALKQRRASAAVRAVVAVELARRAGFTLLPARYRGRWLVGLHDDRRTVTADLGPDRDAGAWDACTGCLCAHEVAFVVLGGLAAAWQREGQPQTARRAAGLRLLLPLDDGLRSAVRADVTRYGDAS